MTSTTWTAPVTNDPRDAEAGEGVLLRLLALALEKVQKKRRVPAKKRRLHRV